MSEGLFDLLYLIDCLTRFIMMVCICAACYKYITAKRKD